MDGGLETRYSDFEEGFIGGEIERVKREKVGRENWGHNGGDNGINYQGEGGKRTLPRRRAYFDRFSFRPYGR